MRLWRCTSTLVMLNEALQVRASNADSPCHRARAILLWPLESLRTRRADIAHTSSPSRVHLVLPSPSRLVYQRVLNLLASIRWIGLRAHGTKHRSTTCALAQRCLIVSRRLWDEPCDVTRPTSTCGVCRPVLPSACRKLLLFSRLCRRKRWTCRSYVTGATTTRGMHSINLQLRVPRPIGWTTSECAPELLSERL